MLSAVSPTSTRQARSCQVPLLTMESLSASRGLPPDSPGFRAMESLATASFIHLEAFFPPQVRSWRLELPRPASRCSPERSAPPETSSDLRTSNPPNPRARHEEQPYGFLRDFEDSAPPEGAAPPPQPGETFPTSVMTTVRSTRQPPVPFETGPRRLSTASLTPLAFRQLVTQLT